jgi:UDP-glucose 4-epimerase
LEPTDRAKTRRALVTGASGFIGSSLLRAFAQNGVTARGAYRATPSDIAPSQDCIAVGGLSASTNWMSALLGVDCVVHLAGPAHSHFADVTIQEQIVHATAALVTQAEKAGIQRFVYVSSIKAACAQTLAMPVSENNEPRPEGAYGRAKLEAEGIVMACPSIRPIVLRPPLVIAPNAKANFAMLMKLVGSGIPLPFAGIHNRRSLLSLESLVAAISSFLLQKDGTTGVFHIADRPALSTSSIVEALGEGMGRRTTVFRGVKAVLPRQLIESLEVDDSFLRRSIGDAWSRDARSALLACGAAYGSQSR